MEYFLKIPIYALVILSLTLAHFSDKKVFIYFIF